MARPKSPTGGKRQKASIADSTPAVSGQPAAAETLQTETMQTETRPVTRKLGVVKTDRPNLVPINLEDEIRRRAYELAQERPRDRRLGDRRTRGSATLSSAECVSNRHADFLRRPNPDANC